jgi:hypothetical protein
VLEVHSKEQEEEASAILAAGRWARQFLISKGGFEAAVRDSRSEPVELIQVRWRGRSRQITVRRALTESRARNIEEPLAPGSFDPWAESAESLAAQTRQLSRCRVCGGEKKVPCPTCQGSARIPCGSCGGSGRTWSPRSRRMIGCRVCRKSGKRICSCFDGKIPCEVCGGKGKVEEWLEVTEKPFDHIKLSGSDLLAQALPNGERPDKLDADSQEYLVPLLFSWRGRTIEEAPPELQGILRLPELTGTNPREDRLQEVVIQIFGSEIMNVIYELGGVSGSVQVQGWDQRIVENDSSRKPFDIRRRRALQGAAFAALAGAALAIWYGGRHSFFVSTANYWTLWILALVLGLSIVPLVLWLVLPAGGRNRKGAIAAVLPAVLVALAQAGLATTGGPSLDHARESAARGQLKAALRESAACFDLRIRPELAGVFHDQLELEKVQQALEPRKAWEAASLPFLTKGAREQAQAHAVAVTFQASEALQESGEFSASAALLDSAPAELKRMEPLVGLRRRAYLEDALPLWTTIESHRKSLEERLRACTEITPYVRGLASLPTTSGDSSLPKKEVEEKCEDLRKQSLRDIQRQREAEAREDERASRRVEAARKAALRRWAYAPLLCNDGTRSPSCICGSSSHRGCCSWHGGVGGCSAPYPD